MSSINKDPPTPARIPGWECGDGRRACATSRRLMAYVVWSRMRCTRDPSWCMALGGAPLFCEACCRLGTGYRLPERLILITSVPSRSFSCDVRAAAYGAPAPGKSWAIVEVTSVSLKVLVRPKVFGPRMLILFTQSSFEDAADPLGQAERPSGHPSRQECSRLRGYAEER